MKIQLFIMVLITAFLFNACEKNEPAEATGSVIVNVTYEHSGAPFFPNDMPTAKADEVYLMMATDSTNLITSNQIWVPFDTANHTKVFQKGTFTFRECKTGKQYLRAYIAHFVSKAIVYNPDRTPVVDSKGKIKTKDVFKTYNFQSKLPNEVDNFVIVDSVNIISSTMQTIEVDVTTGVKTIDITLTK